MRISGMELIPEAGWLIWALVKWRYWNSAGGLEFSSTIFMTLNCQMLPSSVCNLTSLGVLGKPFVLYKKTISFCKPFYLMTKDAIR